MDIVRRFAILLVLLAACERQAAEPASPVASNVPPAPTADSCHREIPDCAAACSLRETGRLEHIDWFDRRCAAVVLGKNPDKAVGPPEAHVVAVPTAVTTTTAANVVPSSTGGTVVSTVPEARPPYDPFSATRQGGSDPTECVAARKLIAKGLARDAQTLIALCEAKGGDAGVPSVPPPPPSSPPHNVDDPFSTRH